MIQFMGWMQCVQEQERACNKYTSIYQKKYLQTWNLPNLSCERSPVSSCATKAGYKSHIFPFWSATRLLFEAFTSKDEVLATTYLGRWCEPSRWCAGQAGRVRSPRTRTLHLFHRWRPVDATYSRDPPPSHPEHTKTHNGWVKIRMIATGESVDLSAFSYVDSDVRAYLNWNNSTWTLHRFVGALLIWICVLY